MYKQKIKHSPTQDHRHQTTTIIAHHVDDWHLLNQYFHQLANGKHGKGRLDAKVTLTSMVMPASSELSKANFKPVSTTLPLAHCCGTVEASLHMNKCKAGISLMIGQLEGKA